MPNSLPSNSVQSGPELYAHVRVVISIIVGLCITTLLNGFARFVQHPKREKISTLHLGWAVTLLLWIIGFWWWEFRLSLVPQWTFPAFFFIILYAIIFYLLSTLMFPSDLLDYSGYEDYFLSRRQWFFGLLGLSYLADIGDTAMKGSAYMHSFGMEYPIRIAIHLAICVVGMLVRNVTVQRILLAIAFLYNLAIILLLYTTQ